MRPVSAKFLRAVTGTHQAVYRARLVEPGLTGVNPDGKELPIIGGVVTLDATTRARATLDLTIDGTGWWPTRRDPGIAPYGAEIYVEYGVQIVGASVEWIGLGYFRVDAIERDAVGGPIRITARDRSAALDEAQLISPRQYRSGVTVEDVVIDLVSDVYPDASIEWERAPGAIGRALVVEYDRWDAIDRLVASVGMIWYWDHKGALVIKTIPSTTDPVWEIADGKSGSVKLMRQTISRIGLYNGVIVTGEAPDSATPFRAAALDIDPQSPTKWGRPYGMVPYFHTDPTITDASQARSTAHMLLQRQLGLPYTVTLETTPNPALELWDPVRIRVHEREPTDTMLLQRLVIPLQSDRGMEIEARQQGRNLIGGL